MDNGIEGIGPGQRHLVPFLVPAGNDGGIRGARQTGGLMPGLVQAGSQAGPDHAGGPGDEDLHARARWIKFNVSEKDSTLQATERMPSGFGFNGI
jgi:hypothetical protein